MIKLNITPSRLVSIRDLCKMSNRFLTLQVNPREMMIAVEGVLSIIYRASLKVESDVADEELLIRFDKNQCTEIFKVGYLVIYKSESSNVITFENYKDAECTQLNYSYEIAESISVSLKEISQIISNSEMKEVSFDPSIFLKPIQQIVSKSEKGVFIVDSKLYTQSKGCLLKANLNLRQESLSMDKNVYKVLCRQYKNSVCKFYRLKPGVMAMSDADILYVWREQYQQFATELVDKVMSQEAKVMFTLKLNRPAYELLSELNYKDDIDDSIAELDFTTDKISITKDSTHVSFTFTILESKGDLPSSITMPTDSLKAIIKSDTQELGLLSKVAFCYSGKITTMINCDINEQ